MSKLFGRVIEILSGNVKMNNTDLDIKFEIPFDDDLDPNLSEVGVYNLSENTRNQLKQGQPFNINAGYKDDKGLILRGRIINTFSERDGTDRLTKIKVIDSVPYNAPKTLQRTYKENIKADALLKDLAQAIGLKVAVIKLPKNKVYEKGYSIDGSVIKEMQNIATECEASCYISRGQAYIRSLKEGDDHNFKLNKKTGLIGSPQYFEEEKNGVITKGYKITSLLQYRMNTGSIIHLEAEGVKAKLRVRKGKHRCDGNNYYTEVEAIL